MVKRTDKPETSNKQPVAEFIQNGRYLYVLGCAMQEYVQDAEKLSYLRDGDDDRTNPSIEVQWRPKMICDGAAVHSSSRERSVLAQ